MDCAGLLQPQDQFLATQRWQGAHATVQGVRVHLQLDPTVLGQSPLSNVQAAQDLDSRRHTVTQTGWKGRHLLQTPVDAQAHPGVAFARLDVNV
jgi:hypothetical protein